MFLFFLTIIVILISIFLNRNLNQIRSSFSKERRFISLPIHYSYCFLIWSLIFFITIFFTSFSNSTKIFLSIISILMNFILIKFCFKKDFNSKYHIENIGLIILSIVASIGVLITLAITIVIMTEAIKFFNIIDFKDFIFGLTWNPQMAMTQEQSISNGSFGVIPVLLGTIMVTIIAMFFAIPIGIMSAIYLCFYAKNKTRDFLKPVLEILAGVPTVVYGYFAVIFIAPFLQKSFRMIGIEIEAESALVAGFVMGVMIIPFISSLTDDALNSVPQNLKDGALALGSTNSEMIKKVVIHAAMPAIISAIILAVSRAIGETMIVVMVSGLSANLTINPLESVTTTTVQIVSLLVGDQEFNNPKTLAAFALASTLFVFTLVLNVIALLFIKLRKNRF